MTNNLFSLTRNKMNKTCIDEFSASPHSTSISTSPTPEGLMGSGTSMILDADGGVETESRKLPSSRFKGVVPQPNGRWGAQIYEKHQRVWLGTFNEEQEAAMAYDIAARRFRGPDAVINLKQHQNDAVEMELEMNFLNSHSKSEIVDMLRKHTYTDELKQGTLNNSNGSLIPNFFKSREPLFEKIVTPSDVGKLNRLVIPKQYAEKHFSLMEKKSIMSNSKGVLLNFEDVNGKVWRFRYSFWNSSQSYVLTKGWSRFVKEKGLSAGDVVSFERSATGDPKMMYIDWKCKRLGSVRLFGVDIFTPHHGEGCNKRNRELPLQFDRTKIPRRRLTQPKSIGLVV